MKFDELKEMIKNSPSGFYVGDLDKVKHEGRTTYLMLVYTSEEEVYGNNIIDPQKSLNEIKDPDNWIDWKVEDYFADGSRWFDAITEEGEKWHVCASYYFSLPRREWELPGPCTTMYFVEIPKKWYKEAKATK